jgi:hypothetical protein
MSLQVLENYVSVDEYARRCGKKRRAIMDRIKAKSIPAIKVDGYYAINVVAHPPQRRVNPYKVTPGGGAHVAHQDLRCIVTWCRGKNIRCYPFLRAVINGQLDGWLIGDEVFAKADDLEAFKKKPR